MRVQRRSSYVVRAWCRRALSMQPTGQFGLRTLTCLMRKFGCFLVVDRRFLQSGHIFFRESRTLSKLLISNIARRRLLSPISCGISLAFLTRLDFYRTAIARSSDSGSRGKIRASEHL